METAALKVAGNDGALGERRRAGDVVLARPVAEATVCGTKLLAGVVCTDVGDFDADRSIVGVAGMAGSLAHVQSLVNGAVHVDQEVGAESAFVMEHLKAAAAGAGGIVVNDHLIHGLPDDVVRVREFGE